MFFLFFLFKLNWNGQERQVPRVHKIIRRLFHILLSVKNRRFAYWEIDGIVAELSMLSSTLRLSVKDPGFFGHLEKGLSVWKASEGRDF